MLAAQALSWLHGRPLEMGARQMQMMIWQEGRLRGQGLLMRLPMTRMLGRQQALRVPKVQMVAGQHAEYLRLRALQAPAMSRLQGRVSAALLPESTFCADGAVSCRWVLHDQASGQTRFCCSSDSRAFMSPHRSMQRVAACICVR